MMSFFNIVMVSILLAGCVSMHISNFNKHNTVGRDVDEVIAELSKRNIVCGQKYSEKSVNSTHISGSVNCGIKEKSLVCPKSYGLYLSYDLITNKVTSVLNDERDNCF